MAQLQEQLAACCAGGGMMQPQGGTGTGTSNGSDILERNTGQLRIQPNPMSGAAVITYTLVSSGRVRLLVSTSTGKQLQVLEEGVRDRGTYTYEWSTASLADGSYNVMLLVDGAPLVQKAIKIAR